MISTDVKSELQFVLFPAEQVTTEMFPLNWPLTQNPATDKQNKQFQNRCSSALPVDINHRPYSLCQGFSNLFMMWNLKLTKEAKDPYILRYFAAELLSQAFKSKQKKREPALLICPSKIQIK